MRALVVVFCCIILGPCNYVVGSKMQISSSANKAIEQKAEVSKKINTPVSQVTLILQKAIAAVSYGSMEKCIREFEDIMNNHFACVFMYKFMFAKFLKTMSNAQKRAVNTCTRNFLIDQYSSRFFGYSDAKIKISEKTKKISGDRCIVPSELTVKNETYNVDWYMQLIDGVWLIVDVRINSTNVLTIQRAGIEGAIEKSGLTAFIKTFVDQYMDLNKLINRARSEKDKPNNSVKTTLHIVSTMAIST